MTKEMDAGTGQVVCGFDGSKRARVALDHAVGYAGSQDLGLRVIVAYTPAALIRPPDYVGYLEPRDAREAAASRVLGEAQLLVPDTLEAHFDLVGGSPAAALIAASEAADLVVVGSRGRGGFAGLLLGSVSNQVVSHAHCPVLVVRQRADRAVRAEGRDRPQRRVVG